MITYIIQTSFTWILLLIIYVCFLQKESFFVWNRFYLLFSLIIGLLLPWVHLEISSANWLQTAVLLEEVRVGAEQGVAAVSTSSFGSLGSYFFIIYCFGFVFSLARMLVEFYQIRKLYKGGIVQQKDGYYLVETKTAHGPFSFGNYLFINPTIAVTSAEYQYILKHEIAHIRQFHSIDIVFAEFLQCLFWFNPLIFLYKNALRDQHEYLADQAVLQDASIKEYGQLLITQSITGLHIEVANHFIYSQLKKRINMMTKKNPARVPFLKYALSLSAFLFAFWTVSCQQQSEQLAQNSTVLQQESQAYLATCKNGANEEEIQKCSNLALMTFVAENLKYPKEAQDKKSEGLAVISFVINTKGLVEKVSIIKDLENGCGEEAARIVNLMNDKKMTWVPAQKDGKVVSSELKLPVRFKLQ